MEDRFMVKTIDSLLFYSAGLGAWTFLEYSLHRFVGHEGKLHDGGHKTHQHHHQFPQGDGVKEKGNYIDGIKNMAPFARDIMLGLNAGFVPVLGLRRSAALTAGILTGWVLYEKQHHDIHNRAPKNEYEKWAWKHHFAHHYKNPKKNHGVGSPVWDILFGTYQEVEEVSVPAKYAPEWLGEGMDGIKVKGKKAA